MKFLIIFSCVLLAACQGLKDSTTGYVTTPGQISGVTWTLNSVSRKGRLIKPLKGHVPTLIFNKDGLVKGFSGLNTFYGRYVLTPSKRTINLGSGFGKENNQGDEALHKQELGYFKALKGNHEVYRHANELYLNNQDKKVVLLFEKLN